MRAINLLSGFYNFINIACLIALIVSFGFFCYWHNNYLHIIKSIAQNDTYFQSIHNGSFTYVDRYGQGVKIGLALMLIVFLSVILYITFSYKRTRKSLLYFSVFYFIFGLASAIAIGIYSTPMNLGTANSTDLIKAYQRIVQANYNVSETQTYGTFTYYWIQLQTKHQCCGAWNATDLIPANPSLYATTQNPNQAQQNLGGILNSNVLSQSGGLPSSCCSPAYSSSCSVINAYAGCGWKLVYMDPVFREHYVPTLGAVCALSFIQFIFSVLIRNHATICKRK